jgi:hypothetical protein
MTLLVCVLCLAPAFDSQTEPERLLDRALQMQAEIEQAKHDGQDPRPRYRQLLEICTQLRQAAPGSFRLCIDEGNAASLAGNWPHALLAYRLAQRLAPNDSDVADRIAAIGSKLQVPQRPATPADKAAAALATQSHLSLSCWLLAALLYSLAWMRITGAMSGRQPPGFLADSLAIAAAAALVTGIFWAHDYRAHQLGQNLAVIRGGDASILREGNGLSYPAVSEDRLRPGTEAVVVGKRGDWLHLRTSGGLIGWAPAAAVEVE